MFNLHSHVLSYQKHNCYPCIYLLVKKKKSTKVSRIIVMMLSLLNFALALPQIDSYFIIPVIINHVMIITLFFLNNFHLLVFNLGHGTWSQATSRWQSMCQPMLLSSVLAGHSLLHVTQYYFL